MYLEAAVGAGKSPLLAALGLFGLIGDGESGAQVYGFAGTHSQARVVFDTAKRFVTSSAALASRLQVRHSEIRHKPTASFWRIVPGTGPGAGCNPSAVFGDEAHEWDSGEAYDALRDRMLKRSQPLLFVATNAGKSQASFCWKLRERAVAALNGNGDPALYPVIWAAADDARTDDPAAWKAANPLIGITIEEWKVAAKCKQAMKDEGDELDFRRLYLSVWPKKNVERWLDLALWDAATPATFVPPADAPVFVGVDLSLSDDLSAVVWLRIDTDGKMYVDSHFWMPRATAERYDKRDSIGYGEWAKGGFVTLLDEPTISNAAKTAIAAAIISRSGKKKPEAVCYDPHRADICVKTLEAASIPCVPIQQGTSLSPGLL